ncbi:MAG: hypothetical protein AB1634_18145 [Thermodesulfobacteriota bacterium]
MTRRPDAPGEQHPARVSEHPDWAVASTNPDLGELLARAAGRQ